MDRTLDTALYAQTPEGIEFAVYPAGFPSRVCAYIVDAGICWTIIICAEIFITSIFDEAGLWFVLLLLFVVDWFFHFIFEIFFQGQSPGKKLVGLRVIQSDGSPLKLSASFLRNTIRFADTFLFLYHIALMLMVSTKGFRRLGDIVGDTLVVYTADARTSLKFRLLPAVYQRDPCQPPHPLSFEEKQAVLMFSRRYSVLGKDRGDEIVRSWTESLGFIPFASNESALRPSEYVLGIAKKYHGTQ
ncbi:MAG: RDD family protein [Spirochaetaceae bacterium]|nr:RDD family protein [Spirochaetaceae bacterium]